LPFGAPVRKLQKVTVSIFILLFASVVEGWWTLRECWQQMRHMSAHDNVEESAYRACSSADAQRSRMALVALLGKIAHLESRHPSDLLHFDAALAYARLSMLAEQSGDTARSRAYMAEALRRFDAAGQAMHRYAPATIKAAVRELDRSVVRY
jgi:hypothetical protein